MNFIDGLTWIHTVNSSTVFVETHGCASLWLCVYKAENFSLTFGPFSVHSTVAHSV